MKKGLHPFGIISIQISIFNQNFPVKSNFHL